MLHNWDFWPQAFVESWQWSQQSVQKSDCHGQICCVIGATALAELHKCVLVSVCRWPYASPARPLSNVICVGSAVRRPRRFESLFESLNHLLRLDMDPSPLHTFTDSHWRWGAQIVAITPLAANKHHTHTPAHMPTCCCSTILECLFLTGMCRAAVASPPFIPGSKSKCKCSNIMWRVYDCLLGVYENSRNFIRFTHLASCCNHKHPMFDLSSASGLKRPTAPSLHPSSSSSSEPLYRHWAHPPAADALVFKHSRGVQTHYKIS